MTPTTRERWEVRCDNVAHTVVSPHRESAAAKADRARACGCSGVRLVHVTTTLRSRAWTRNGQRVRVRLLCGDGWVAERAKDLGWWLIGDVDGVHDLGAAVAAANAWADAQPSTKETKQ